jgi:hypothetical protein
MCRTGIPSAVAVVVRCLVALLSVLLGACGPSPNNGGGTGGAGGEGGGATVVSGTGGGAAAVCVRGTSIGCVCTDGRSGAQVCSADGSGYEPCMCTGTGSGGALGAGGVQGTGGSPSGGTTGSAGRGGATGAGGQNVDAGVPIRDAATADGKVSTPVDGGYSGRWVTVQIVDAIIAPGKADGTTWDGFGTIPSDVLTDVDQALAAINPVEGILAVLAGPALNGALISVDKPDPYGVAQATTFGVVGDTYWIVDRTHALPDTYTPIWPTFGYTNVPIDSDVRIAVEIWDQDISDDDPIGVAQINSADLKAALAAQAKYEVRVDDQTDGQLLFIGVSVVQQAGLE